MKLGLGFSFEQLYTRDGLVALDAHFVKLLEKNDVALRNRLLTARAAPESIPDLEHSQLLLDLAPQAEDFIAALFGIEKELHTLQEKHHALAPLFACKRLFVQRRAAKGMWREGEVENWRIDEIENPLSPHLPISTSPILEF